VAWQIRDGADETMAVYDPPTAADRGVVFICAHGAGGHMDDRAVVAAARAVCAQGVGVVRFNFF